MPALAFFDGLINWVTNPAVLFFVAIILFLLSIQFAEVWTRPKVAGLIGVLLVAFVVYGTTKHQVALTLSKPDNIPIVMVLGSLGFLYWLAMRQAVLNDKRIDAGEAPREAAE